MVQLSCVTVSQLSWLLPLCLRRWQLGISSLSRSTTKKKMYAAGKFPGGFMKREGRPSTDATLTARLIDRQSALCLRKVFVMKCRSDQHGPFLWWKCLCTNGSYVWFILGSFYLRYSIWRTNRWGTSGLCRWSNHHQPKSRTSRAFASWIDSSWDQACYQHGWVWCQKNCQKKSCWKPF